MNEQKLIDGRYQVIKQQCFYMIAYQKKRCPNPGVWRSPNCLPPANQFLWCDEHKHDDDVLAQNSLPR